MKYTEVRSFSDLEKYLEDIFAQNIESTESCPSDKRSSEKILEKVEDRINQLLSPYEKAVDIIKQAAEGRDLNNDNDKIIISWCHKSMKLLRKY